MIAVLCALENEIEPVVAVLRQPQRDEIAGFSTWTGEVNHQPVVVALAGMGKVATAALAAMLWERHRPGSFVFTGVAGGLAPSMQVGDIVIGDRTIQHDWGTLEPGGLERYQAGHLPIYRPTDEFGFAATSTLVSAAQHVASSLDLDPVLGRAPAVHVGTIATGDQFVHDPATRDRLHADTGALAVEMEGGALAQFCHRVGADHVVIRSLSDLAGDETIEHFDEFVPPVAANSARVVLGLLADYSGVT